MGCGYLSEFKKKVDVEPAASRFELADDLEIDLVLAEPIVQQPLHLSFDHRGRLWVVQYIQYPDPAGLREVSRDKVWRVVYDQIPPPPPHAVDSPFRGKDRISVHEDTNGDGEFDTHKVFVEGLSLATSVAHGRGGIWVTNPPYLLFYPDADGDDVPDSAPIVHLKGFGIEDSHSVASSLTWGPDGWLYGAQGSTVSGAVTRPGLDEGDGDAIKSMGQNIWRYHPERRVYEIFAEGGGNTFGVEIDSKGRVYSGHNGGDTRGFHYVQGGYYQKTFGKHGQLSNPNAFGYFPAMKNAKVARFVHQFLIYESNGLTPRFYGNLIGADILHSNLVLSKLKPLGSTFETVDIERSVVSKDRKFRPVHVTEAPDGSVFVADWYDEQVNHYRNHEGQIDHEKGRIYRIRRKGSSSRMEVASFASPETQLTSSSRWHRQTALRLIADRRLQGRPTLIEPDKGQLDLESLWAVGLSGDLNEEFGMRALISNDPHVRRWAVRLLEDHQLFTSSVATKIRQMAEEEQDLEVLSQIASTAKRVKGEQGLRLAAELAKRSDLANDPHLPLLTWWALEPHFETMPEKVVAAVVGTAFAEKSMRRLAVSGRFDDLALCGTLLRKANGDEEFNRLVQSLEKGLAGAGLVHIPNSLRIELGKGSKSVSLPIRLQQGEPGAMEEALLAMNDENLSVARRKSLIATLAHLDDSSIADALLRFIDNENNPTLQTSAIVALANFDHPSTVEKLLGSFADYPAEAKAATLDLLTSRRALAQALVDHLASGKIDKSEISPAHVEKIRLLDSSLASLWPSIPVGVEKELRRLRSIASKSGGVPKRGEAIFAERCGACHVMFSKGGDVGPSLTSYQKNDLDTLLLSVVDPSAEIREGYEQVVVTLKGGAVHSGFLTGKTERTITIRELSGAERAIANDAIAESKVIERSLMPSGLLGGLDDSEVRDLLAFLRSTTPPY